MRQADAPLPASAGQHIPALPDDVARSVARGEGSKLTEWLNSDDGHVDARDAKGRTALMLAVAVGQRAILADLISRGANLELAQRQGTTALMFACYSGDVYMAKSLLLAKAKLSTVDNRGLTAQDYAQLKDHIHVTMLLRQFATVAASASACKNRPDSPTSMTTSLTTSSGSGTYSVSSSFNSGSASSGSYAGSGSYGIASGDCCVPVLASSSAADVPSSSSLALPGTACSASHGAGSSSEGTVGSAADVSSIEATLATAAAVAAVPASPPSRPVLPSRLLEAAQNGDVEAVRAYLEGGGAVDAVDTQLGGTMLMCASSAGHVEIMEALITHNASVDVRDANGCSALGAACFATEDQAVERLLDAGASVNIADNVGLTPLMLASLAGRLHLVKLLLASGARKETRDINDHTALMYAQSKGHAAVVMQLSRARLTPEPRGRQPRYTPEEMQQRSIAADRVAAELLRADLSEGKPPSRAHSCSSFGCSYGNSGGSSPSPARASSWTGPQGTLEAALEAALAEARSCGAMRAAAGSQPQPQHAYLHHASERGAAGGGGKRRKARMLTSPAALAVPGHGSRRSSHDQAEAEGSSSTNSGAATSSCLDPAPAPSPFSAPMSETHPAASLSDVPSFGSSHVFSVGTARSGDDSVGSTTSLPDLSAMDLNAGSAAVTIPEAFCCPITQLLMADPVVTCDGHTYERSSITDWLARRATSPLTGEPLVHTNLVANTMARGLIREFAERHPTVPDCRELLDRLRVL